MTPEEYDRATKRTAPRYGYPFDPDVNQFLPRRNKNGKVGARQPKNLKKTVAYWRAQCSFRDLKSSVTVGELQARLEARDKSKDAEIRHRLHELQRQIWEEDDRRNDAEAEIWWREPVRTLLEHLNSDPGRAIEEDLEKGGVLSYSCELVPTSCLNNLQGPALHFGLSWQRVRPPYVSVRLFIGYHGGMY